MKLMTLRAGVPYIVDVAVGSAYDQDVTLVVDTTLFTLPNSQTYNTGNNELIVWVDGIAQMLGLDYLETNSTQITFQKTIKAGQNVRVRR